MTRLRQDCARVVKRHCGNLVTMFAQPCDNLATVSKDKVIKNNCGNLVTRL